MTLRHLIFLENAVRSHPLLMHGSCFMNSMITKLAADRLRIYRKKTRTEILVIALIAMSVFPVNILIPPLKELYMSWCVENHGTWYAYIEIPDEIYDLCRYELDQGSDSQGRKDLLNGAERAEPAKEEDLLHYAYLHIQT